MNGVAEIYRAEFDCQFEKAAQFFERALVITPFAGDGEHDVIVMEALS
jgi:hypothetical protein